MKNLIKMYKTKIQNAKGENDIKDIIIGISKDCSAYKLSWEAFLDLRNKTLSKGKELKVAWGQR